MIRSIYTTAKGSPAGVKTAGLLFLSLFFSCSTATEKLITLGSLNGFEAKEVKTDKFTVKILGRTFTKTEPVRFYIQGDGNGFTRYRPAKNPTPRGFLVPEMTFLDWSPNRIYMARPCMYVDLGNEKNCEFKKWTLEKYSKEMVNALNQVIDKYKLDPKQKIELVGYSGGGAMAILVAAHRNDVQSIRTIAANLSSNSLTKHYSHTPLEGLDPIDFAQKVSQIPQIHFYGDSDSVIPSWVSENFVKRSKSKCVHRIKVEATHTKGWIEKWNYLHQIKPVCLKSGPSFPKGYKGP